MGTTKTSPKKKVTRKKVAKKKAVKPVVLSAHDAAVAGRAKIIKATESFKQDMFNKFKRGKG